MAWTQGRNYAGACDGYLEECGISAVSWGALERARAGDRGFVGALQP